MMKSEDISLEDIFLKVTNQLNENSTTEDVNDSEENDTTHLVKEGAIDEDHTR